MIAVTVSTPVLTAVVSVVGLCGVLVWRVREGQRPITARKIVFPPLGMSTGFCMFVVPGFRVPWAWALGAFAIGATLLAYPLLRTSSLRREGGVIWMKRSVAFFLVVVVLAAVRYFARGFFDKYLTLEQTGGLFFILAFGMILRWRMALYALYRKLTREPLTLEPAEEAAVE
ncbi:MAG TPA: cytochrome c biogenesis protein CcdC [Terracidiphilus sp.]|nr:cytochrome c biogenesis protein CcdC [Terracidiphilus sp.]